MKRTCWIIFTFMLPALSGAAVAIRIYGYPDFVPWNVAQAFDGFIEPGSAVWWLTMGGVFQAFPSNAAGYFVVIAGNTLLWLFAAVILVATFGVVRRVIGRVRR